MLHYKSVFKKDNRHSLTEVELFDLSQSNSEHSRHWFSKENISPQIQKIIPYLIPYLILQILK